MESIRPLPGLAPWIGGKRNLAKRLAARIEAIPHHTYAEPFVGMGGVFLRRGKAAKSEVINDLNRDVATLFRVLQRHYVPFLEMMRFQITTRTEFERLIATDPDTLTDLERAARLLYLQYTGFGGKVAGRTFGVDPLRGGRFDIRRIGPMLEAAHERLAGVAIECLPYDAFIRRYDRDRTLFYIDPPYSGSTTTYGAALFGEDDFARLAAVLRAIQGRFILSLSDTDRMRDIFAGFDIESVETLYTVAGRGHRKRAAELIITDRKAA